MNWHGIVVKHNGTLEVRVAHGVDEVEQVAVERRHVAVGDRVAYVSICSREGPGHRITNRLLHINITSCQCIAVI